jgi:AraC-like DNA-binding protein
VGSMRHHQGMSAAPDVHASTEALASAGSHRGILARPDALTFSLRRLAPAPDLAWCVDRYWVVEWNRPDAIPGEGRVLPHPCVNVVLEQGRLNAHGVATEVFVRRLVGTGGVFGIKFRPGGFRPFADRSVSMLTDRELPASALVPGAAELEVALCDGSTEDRVAATEDYLRSRSVDPDPRALLVNAVTDALVGDPHVTRVAHVQAMFDISERALQRTFAEYLGVTPRWVLRRARLHLAAERVIELGTQDSPTGWADVAVDLGYVDQAHFIRDFKAVIGETPARWAASLGR